MTKQERRERMAELSNELWYAEGEEYEKLYAEYCELNIIDAREYREEQEPLIKAYFETHIKGKTWEEVDKDRFDFYSDWHKDVYGFRPRTLEYCGD